MSLERLQNTRSMNNQFYFCTLIMKNQKSKFFKNVKASKNMLFLEFLGLYLKKNVKNNTMKTIKHCWGKLKTYVNGEVCLVHWSENSILRC